MYLPAVLTLVVCILCVTAVDQKGKEKAGKDVMTLEKVGKGLEKMWKGEMTKKKAGKGIMTVEQEGERQMTVPKAGEEITTGENTVERSETTEKLGEDLKTTTSKEESKPLVLTPMQLEIFDRMVREKYGIAETAGCNSPEALNIIKEHIVKERVTETLAGKTFTDVWRREVCISFMQCVLTKFSMKDGALVNEVLAVRTDQSNTFEEKWKETSVNGVFTVNGVWNNETANNPTFIDTLRFFYADNNVIGTYTCREEGLFSKSNVWMVAISVVKDREDSEEAKESLKKAEEKMKKIRELSGEMDKMKRENCPANF